jgi:uncharacterized protein YoxC
MDALLKMLPIILYILLSILIVVLIVLAIKTIKTLNKVDQTIEDVNYKMSKLNGIFTLVDRSADAISMLTDKIVGTVTTGISSLFKKRKKKEEEDENE